jgi:hypothetical protein
MLMSCGIFVQFFKCEILKPGKFVSFIANCILCIEGGIKRWVRNNRKDDDGFKYLRNWLIFVVTVASWIHYVSNGRRINSISGNILTKIIILWPPNRACTCKMAFSSLVIQITILCNRTRNEHFAYLKEAAQFNLAAVTFNDGR